MKRFTIAATTLLIMLGIVLQAIANAQESFPEIIFLPTGFQPEGIALGPGDMFYTGSLADGTILVGDLRTGEIQELVSGSEGQFAVGMSFDARSGYLFVAGGRGAVGRVYDTHSGDELAVYPLPTNGGQSGDFINDVVVTRDAAYFTNSFAPEISRVPLGPAGGLPDPADVEKIPLGGDWVQVPGINANGIEATANGETLFIVNSAGQTLYRVDPESGDATEIDLGGELLTNGDGLVLLGKTLYVVKNRLNQIAVISLSPDLDAGTVVDEITDPLFNVPTTAAKFGDALYVVNAKFGASPETEYEIVKVFRH